jgi:predicted phosphoadenosine phosphosulfate sulfurtransferase
LACSFAHLPAPKVPNYVRITLPSSPEASNHLQLYGYVDASHANDLCQRCSTTGYAFLLGGSVIAYRSKMQSITATSSTKAEFLASVSAGKVACYLCLILNQLGFVQQDATPICEDNKSTIKMVNADRLTEQSSHIGIQYFVIQDWKKAGHLILQKIPGII